MAVDDEADFEPENGALAGPLRIASTVEVRPYAWVLVRWIDDAHEEDRREAPDARNVYVMSWRDRDMDLRREEASTLELAVLKSVLDGVGGAPAGVKEEAWREVIEDLRAAGVLVGGP